jgi:Ser/Thr protein kinase RdoA (MazF antagonist)
VFINPDEEQLRIIGRNIALIHNVTSVCTLQHERVVYDTGSTLERPLKIISHRFQEMPGEYAFLRDMTDRTIKKIKQFDVSKFSYGYCHYDLLSKNFHFDENNAITFFDFDWLGRGFLVNDLMTFYIQLFFLEHYNMITREEADRNFGVLLEGYREQRNLSAEEVEAIPWLGVMFWIFGFGFYEDNFDDFSNTFLTPKFIRDRVAMIKKWVDNYC